MAEELSNDNLKKLVDVIRARQSSPAKAAPSGYDFRQPRQRTSAYSQRLEGFHDRLGAAFRASLGQAVRTGLDLEESGTEQILYADFIGSLANPCTVYRFELAPPGQECLLLFDRALLTAVIDRTLGGPGRGLSAVDRPLTKIEIGLARRLAERLLAEFNKTISEYLPSRLGAIKYEDNPELIRLLPPEDNLIVTTFEVNSSQFGGQLQLAYPLSAIDPLLKQLAPSKRSTAGRTAGNQAVEQIEIDVSVRLAKGTFSLQEVSQLRLGDTLKLDTAKGEPAVVFLGNKAKYLAKPGLHNGGRAVKIIDAIPPEEEEQHR